MIPDYCEAITAYRCWNVYPNGLLVGQSHAEPWPPYEAFVGRCGHVYNGTAHIKDGRFLSAPVKACDCGVHALKAADAAELRLKDEIQQQASGYMFVSYWNNDGEVAKGRVWGAVKLWGRVIEHEIGYRAEFAYPSALLCEDPQLAAVVAALYGVSCEIKKLPRPKPQRDPDEDLYWYASKIMVNPIHTYGAYGTGFAGNYYTQTPASIAPPAATKQPSLIQQPSLAQIDSLGATAYQKREADRAAANRAAYFNKDWRSIMKDAFHVKKDEVTE